jgi:hypothetical protein
MSPIRVLILSLAALLPAGASAASMKIVPLEARDLVLALNLNVTKFQFTLPARDEPGKGYGLRFWVEDWRERRDQPRVLDEGYLGLGRGGTTYLLVKLPSSESAEYSFSTPVNSTYGKTALHFGDEGASAWHITDRELVVGQPITLAMRVEGEGNLKGKSTDEKFDSARRDASLRVIAFRVEIREVE